MLRPFNKKERLLYATKVEHFLLHCLLNLVNDTSQGIHFLFGDLLKMEIGIFDENSLERNIQEKRNGKFYLNIDFDTLLRIYQKLLKKEGIGAYSVEDFYKLDTYIYDKEKYDQIMKILV